MTMLLWEQAVEVLRESIFAYALACNGNLGAGILAVTFLARLALLPLGIRMARAAAAQQRAMARLQPSLDALRKTHKSDSKRLAEETSRLLAREGVSPFSVGGCLGALTESVLDVGHLGSSHHRCSLEDGRWCWLVLGVVEPLRGRAGLGRSTRTSRQRGLTPHAAVGARATRAPRLMRREVPSDIAMEAV